MILPSWSSVLPRGGTRRFELDSAVEGGRDESGVSTWTQPCAKWEFDFVKNVLVGEFMNLGCMVRLSVVLKTVWRSVACVS